MPPSHVRTPLAWTLAAAAAAIVVALLALSAAQPRHADRMPEPPRPPRMPAPAPPTLDTRLRELELREQDSPHAYAGFWRAYSSLLPEARGTPHEAAIRDRVQSFELAARRAWMRVLGALQSDVRDLVGRRRAADALARVRAFRVPDDIDIPGLAAADLQHERARLERIVQLEEQWRAASERIDRGDLDPVATLDDFLRDGDSYVRAEAEAAIRELDILRLQARAWRRLRDGRPGAFGRAPLAPLATERRFRELTTPAAATGTAQARTLLKDCAAAASFDQFRRAATSVKDALDRATRDAWLPVPLFLRAEWSYAVRGDVSAALGDLDAAVLLHGRFLEARLARAIVLADTRAVSRATEEIERLAAALPEPLHTPVERALGHLRAGNLSGAADDLRKAMASLPDDLEKLPELAPSAAPRELPAWSDGVVHETEHYRWQAEPGLDPARVRELADGLEAARPRLAGILPGAPQRAGRASVYLFATYETYAPYADKTWEDRLGGSHGRHLESARAILVFQTPSVTATLTHEAMHEFAAGLDLPTWLDEGIAEYAEAGDGVQRRRLPDLQGRLKAGWNGTPFDAFVNLSYDDFHGTNEDLNYSQAWSMVHYLRHSRLRTAWDDFVGALVRTRDWSAAWSATIGRAGFDGAGWRRHVLDLK